MQFRKFIPILLVFVLSLAACSRSKPSAIAAKNTMSTATAMSTAVMPTVTNAVMMEKSQAMMDTATPEPMMGNSQAMMSTATPDTMMGNSQGMMDTATPGAMMGGSLMAPAWFSTTLTNVTTQEVFTINDFKGKVILVETMAEWCTTCLQQQKQLVELHHLLGNNSDFVSLGMDIDPNEDPASLQTYAEKNGFSWLFAVAPAEVSREIGNQLGSQFLNPTAAPMFIVDRHGEVHPLPFGVKSADDLRKAVEMYLMAMG
jgi:thiol-disulfide isomerase/thioredoxin